MKGHSLQLNKTRKLAQTVKQEQEAGEDMKLMRGVNKVNMLLQSIKDEPIDEDVELIESRLKNHLERSLKCTPPFYSGAGKMLVLDSVAEYVKNLGDTALAEEKARCEEEDQAAKQEVKLYRRLVRCTLTAIKHAACFGDPPCAK